MFAFCCFVVLHIAWAYGLLPGMKGFAMAEDVEQVIAKLDLSLKLQVEGRLRALKQEKCLAKSDSLRDALQAEIDELQHDHKRLDGSYYTLPSCREYNVEGVEGMLARD